MRLEAFAYCEKLVREHDINYYLAALFAPAERRPFLLALYAFELEIGRVKFLVHDPMAGMIRLQWWRDAIAGSRNEEAQANPVAAAVLETIDFTGLGIAPLIRAIEARQGELEGEDASAAEAALLAAGAEVLGAGNDVVAAAAENGGRAIAALREPSDREKARKAYADFRAVAGRLPNKALPAFLPVARVPLLLRRPQATQWRTQVAYARTAWFGFPKI